MLFSINIFLNVLLNNYFQTSNCLCYFTNRNDIIYLNNIVTITYDLKISPTFNLTQRCDAILINHNAPRSIVEQIETVLRYQNQSRFNHSNRKYIVISYEQYDIKHLFDSEALRFIVDFLNIVIHQNHLNSDIGIDEKIQIEIYTHTYVGNDCNKSYLLDVWFSRNCSFMFGNNLYPNKLHNQNGRIIGAVTFTHNPYSLPDHNTGSELRMIQEFSKKYNCFLKIVRSKGMWGTMFSNYTGVGMYHHMLADETDVGFCECFYFFEYYQYLDYTCQYMVATVTCLVPPPILENTLFILFPHFQSSLWLLLVSTYSLLALVMSWSTKFSSKTEILRYSKMKNMISIYSTEWAKLGKIILNQPVYVVVGRMKFFLMKAYFLTIILYTLYSSHLSSNLTIPEYSGAINTVEDLAESVIPWGAAQRKAWLSVFDEDNTPKYRILKEKFVELNSENLKQIGKVAVLIVRLRSGYFSFEQYITDDVLKSSVVMKDNLYYQHTTMVTRKHSVILPLLNSFIQQITASGLNIYWEKEAIHNTGYEKQMMVTQSMSAKISASSFAYFKGLYLIWLAGCLLSAICFVLEYTRII